MPEVHFGGPDRPQRHLRDVLQAHIEAVPSGGRIDWMTYYFRDRALADALIAASDRGVKVTLRMEGQPRRKAANRAVLAMLQAHGLGGGLRVHHPAIGPHAHLHSKIYAFSHPEPHVLIGSFNPSGDDPEDAAVVAEIGDQDRGHNLLVDYRDARIVDALIAQVRHPGSRFALAQNRVVKTQSTALYFFPRLCTGILDAQLGALKPGARVMGAISHLKTGSLSNRLAAAARRGVDVRLLVHDTERRVPQTTVERLQRAGVRVARYLHPEGLPLHAKILLVEDSAGRTAWFGSYNYNPRSRWLNRELLVRERDPGLFAALAHRFEVMSGTVLG